MMRTLVLAGFLLLGMGCRTSSHSHDSGHVESSSPVSESPSPVPGLEAREEVLRSDTERRARAARDRLERLRVEQEIRQAAQWEKARTSTVP